MSFLASKQEEQHVLTASLELLHHAAVKYLSYWFYCIAQSALALASLCITKIVLFWSYSYILLKYKREQEYYY